LGVRLQAQSEQAVAVAELRVENERLRIEIARGESERSAAAKKAQWAERAQETLREMVTALASEEPPTTNAEHLLSRTRERLLTVL